MAIKPQVQSFFSSVKLGLIFVGLGILIFFVGIILVFSMRIDFPLPMLGLPIAFIGFGIIAVAKLKAMKAVAEGSAGKIDQIKEDPEGFRNSSKPYTKAAGGILHDLISSIKDSEDKSHTPSHKNCPKCGHSNEEADKFCGQCGQTL